MNTIAFFLLENVLEEPSCFYTCHLRDFNFLRSAVCRVPVDRIEAGNGYFAEVQCSMKSL